MFGSTVVSVQTAAAGYVSVGCAPSLPTELVLEFFASANKGAAISAKFATVNVDTKYDNSPFLSFPKFGSGKKVNSFLCGDLFVVALRRVIMAGLSLLELSVACLTVERSGVSPRVAADFDGSVHRRTRLASIPPRGDVDVFTDPCDTDTELARCTRTIELLRARAVFSGESSFAMSLLYAGPPL